MCEEVKIPTTELEMKDFEYPRLKSSEDLKKFIDQLVDMPHDYGTSVYAMSLAATAAFNFVAGQLGVTGFQASCADLDIMRRTRGMKHGFKIIDFGDLLYPQYCDGEHFPTWQAMLKGNIKSLGPVAEEMLAGRCEMTSSDVTAHWEKIVELWRSTFGTLEGEACNRDGCNGVIENSETEPCFCNACNAPCAVCERDPHTCPECGWEASND